MVTKPWYVKKTNFVRQKNRVFHRPPVTRDWLARVRLRSGLDKCRVENVS
jgi:hypothetical protein